MRPLLIRPDIHYDDRGYFAEFYSHRRYKGIGIDIEFVQDNHSLSRNVGTLRGLHFQAPPSAQSKLVHCGRGAIFDVVVDIRCGSPTFGQWEGHKLSEENGHQLYVPIGFAHGFITLEPNSQIVYKCSSYYDPETERGVRWDSCGVEWPLIGTPILSQKDRNAPSLSELESPFIFGDNC